MRRMSSTRSSVERLLAPRHGPGVCPRCLNLTDNRDGLCRACGTGEQHLAAVVPISYSVGGEWLHRVIASYKRDADPSVPDAVATLAGICERFLATHECCIAGATGVGHFDLVTSVPSSSPRRDARHPLSTIVGELVSVTRERYQRLLSPEPSRAVARRFDPGRFTVTRPLAHESVLLIDDMWTSGASAESAAAALRAAGAGTVVAVVIARHVNRGFDRNDTRLRRLADSAFDFERCVLCHGRAA
jgi:predicted amidophosphoribosyltransferase